MMYGKTGAEIYTGMKEPELRPDKFGCARRDNSNLPPGAVTVETSLEAIKHQVRNELAVCAAILRRHGLDNIPGERADAACTTLQNVLNIISEHEQR